MTVSRKQLIINLTIWIRIDMPIVFKETSLSLLGHLLQNSLVVLSAGESLSHDMLRIQPKNDPLCRLTSKTISSHHCGWFWKASLVFVTVHGPDSEQTSPTLHPGYRNGVPSTTVGEPAIVTPVQTESPGSMELPRVCQHSTCLLTLLSGFFKSHLVSDR